MTAKKHPEKGTDIPPRGDRNPDPITNEPGAHPVETGVGAALGGTAVGAAAGAVAGPLGAGVGAVVGAIAGGLAGKSIGERIDPTLEDAWFREYSDARKGHKKGESCEAHRAAFRYGIDSYGQHAGKRFDEVEEDLKADWERAEHRDAQASPKLAWEQARGPARDAFERTLKLHEEELQVEKEPVRTGEVDIRKEVITEHKQISVPVEREEVVIERRKVHKAAPPGSMTKEEIRIPVKEEQVRVTKKAVVKEEVNVGKRKVHETKTVGDDVKREELVVKEEGKAKVHRH